jgi:hypothetical protein
LLTNARNVKVRIKMTPLESEIDGVRLDRFKPGTVRDVSPILGAWLIAERYAEPEMRRSVESGEEYFSGVKDNPTCATANDRPRRRRSDR